MANLGDYDQMMQDWPDAELLWEGPTEGLEQALEALGVPPQAREGFGISSGCDGPTYSRCISRPRGDCLTSDGRAGREIWVLCITYTKRGNVVCHTAEDTFCQP